MTARTITLAELTSGLSSANLARGGERAIRGICYDSRRVKPGDLFVAVPGTRADGSRFVSEAIAAGAVAVLARDDPGASVPAVIADDVRLAMGQIAARFFGRPDLEIEVVGVTGTNGKTTVSYLIESILLAAGKKPGVMGTVNYRVGGVERPAATTTPESVDIFSMLDWMRVSGATHAVMEVSSHALDQKRVSGLKMDIGVFTNLTRDHLDYHRDMDEYFEAKKKLFSEVIRGRWREGGPAAPLGVTNLDSGHGRKLARTLADLDVRRLGFAIEAEDAEVRPDSPRVDRKGIFSRIRFPEGSEIAVNSGLIGGHNLENILAAAAATYGMGIDPEAIARGVEGLAAVPGRLQPVANSLGVSVLVDYAHTPDALAHAVDTCRGIAESRLITVMGCGGDRDPGKRPLMGRIAVAGSDITVITSDNPRTEDPLEIIRQVVAGIDGVEAERIEVGQKPAPGKYYLVIPDRREAILAAVARAEAKDIVLIAGKGHEDYQILGTQKIHFDDREEAAKALREREG